MSGAIDETTGMYPLPAGEQAGVVAGERHGEGAVFVDVTDDLAADLPRENHAHHVHRLGTGHTVATAEFALDAQAIEHRGDLGSPAMDDDRADTGVAQEDHVFGERLLQSLVDHGVAAELDDHDAVVEPLEPVERLDEGRDLVACGDQRILDVCHQVAYALFS
jgi:hypothetical protein